MGLAAPAGRGRPGRQRLHAGCARAVDGWAGACARGAVEAANAGAFGLGRPPRPCGRSLANGAACRRPARRASSNCRFRRSTCCFRRSLSRCRRLFLRCCLFASRSRPVNFPCSRSTSASRFSTRFSSALRSAVVTPTLCHNPEVCRNCHNLDGRVPSTLTEDRLC